MSFNLQLARSALKDYLDLNEPFKTKIKEQLDNLEKNGLNNPNIKPLTGDLKGNYRIRKGDYRIVFTIEQDIITVVAILHRKDTYKKR
jgi:mRNA interferase RelE/StbE